MSIAETLLQHHYTLEDDSPDGQVWKLAGGDVNYYVSVAEDGIIQAVKMPTDHEAATTVVHFNRVCEELLDLLRKWDVTPAEFD